MKLEAGGWKLEVAVFLCQIAITVLQHVFQRKI